MTEHLTPGSFRLDHEPDDPPSELAGLIAVLELQERLPGVRRLRDWAMEAVDVRPGDVAVDVGCGTGTEVLRLAAPVGEEGRALGVEPHAGLRSEAARSALGWPNVEVVDGDAGALPFDSGSVDVLRCERVLQHLDDPQGAVTEFARVLAPGGRVVLIDSDWDTMVLSAGRPDVVRRVLDGARARMAHPHAGRHLRGFLTRAGLLVDPDIAATAVVWPEDALRRLDFLRIHLDLGVAEDQVTADEVAELERDLRRAVDAGEAFCAVTMYGVVARRH